MKLSRQLAIKSVALSLGLPYLDLFADTNKGQAPRRLGVVFFGNGVNPEHWWAKGDGKAMELSKSLSPLAPIKDQLLYFKGLWNPMSVAGPGGHYPKMNILSGAKVKKSTTEIEVGKSMDQVIAQHLRGQTKLNSMVLGAEGTGYSAGDGGYSQMYSNFISWSADNSPTAKEINPRNAFDRLFSSAKGLKAKKSILDDVLQDMKRLNHHLTAGDKQKLAEYQNSIRELELRMENAEKISQDTSRWKPSTPKKIMKRPADIKPGFIDDYLRIMFDIMVLAYQLDKTRVATFMMYNDLSNVNFSHINGIKGGSHEISHHTNRPDKLLSYQKVNQHTVHLWGEFLQKLHTIKEGERTLLENSMMMLCSSLHDGNAHNSKELPVLLVGKGGGSLQTGRCIDVSGKKEEKKLCGLHIALMNRMGVQDKTFGDATKVLNV